MKIEMIGKTFSGHALTRYKASSSMLELNDEKFSHYFLPDC